MNFVMFLHVLAAIVLIGPLVVVTSAAPRAVDAADSSLLRWFTRTTRTYTIGSLLVFGLGVALVPLKKGRSYGEFWLSSSMTLYIVAVALLVLLVQRDMKKALVLVEAGEPAAVQRGRILGVGIAVNVIWAVIVLLMVFQPGG